MTNTQNLSYFNSFKHSSMFMYGCPIRAALYDRKMTKKKLIELLAQYGLIYNYRLLCAVLEGRASSNFNLHYFSHIYRVLNIPINAHTVYNGLLRWEEIKQFKKQRRNTNRIKKGLEPIP